MCGLTGFVEYGRALRADAYAPTCGAMADALAHRGPDDQGVWVDAASGVALGHRRLSILDLSPLGHQPMTSESGRYVIAYNGEIYNFESLRAELASHAYRGRSDTEVVLAAFEQWGVEATLSRLNGMFALAVWDSRERALWLARDRFGEKPLYYGLTGRSLVFGSELKALCAFPGFRRDIDRGALAQFLRHGYVPAPRSIFAGIHKLPAGSWLRAACEADVERTPTPYFRLADVARDGLARPFAGTDVDAIDRLESLLQESVKLRMVSDVPLGAFLSGGIDSSTVVALMQAGETRRVRTFTIGFAEAAYNEADAGRAVASHLATDHTELYVTPAEAQAVIPRLPTLFDEPFADSSQVPTFLVAQLARQHVTVALSGDAGDELFGGYTRYLWAESIWRRLRRVPTLGRSTLARAIRAARPSRFDRAFAQLGARLPVRLQQRMPGDKLEKLAEILGAATPDDLYLQLVSGWKDPGALVRTAEPRHALLGVGEGLDGGAGAGALADFTDRMMYADTLTYLPDDILVKVDRAAMGVSLETRVPLLDPAILRFAWSLPRRMKVRDGKGKWILREVLARHVPRALFERPKMGFGIPLEAWLRGPLRAWAEDELSLARLEREGVFDPAPIRQKWEEHVSGRRNWQAYLWPVLMFQAWREHWVHGLRR